jgi:AcrR family transcriptional regulator
MARRRGISREDVVATALELADREGLDAVSLAAVAARLGIRSPSLYAHVSGLPGLHRELALAAAAAMAESFDAAVAGRSGLASLRSLAVAYRQFAARHPGLYEAVQRAVKPGEDDELYRALAGVVVPVFRSLAEVGADPTEQVHLTRVYRSALHGFVVLEQTGGFGMPESVDESFRRMVEVLIAAVREVAAGPPRSAGTEGAERAGGARKAGRDRLE